MRVNLKVDHVSKTYDNGISAISDVSFEMKEKEVVSLIGNNGAGKTTLCNIIAGLLTPTKGAIFINEKETTELSESKSAYIRRSDLGLIYPNNNFFPQLSLFQNIEFPLLFTKMTKKERKNKVNSSVQKLGLKKLKTKDSSTLSIADEIKFALARLAVQNAAVVLMDEPFISLNIVDVSSVMKLIKRLANDGMSFLICTDDVAISKITDRSLYLTNGKLGK